MIGITTTREKEKTFLKINHLTTSSTNNIEL